MLLVNVLCQPARKPEFARLDGERKSFAILDRPEELLVVEVLEYRIAFLDLARPGEPQVERTSRDACVAAGLDVGLQGIAVETRVALALVELLVDALEALEIALAGQRQGIAIAQLPAGSQRAVLREEPVDFSGVDGFQVGAQPCGPQVGPQHIALQKLSLGRGEVFNGTPVAPFDVGIHALEENALVFGFPGLHGRCRERTKNEDSADGL